LVPGARELAFLLRDAFRAEWPSYFLLGLAIVVFSAPSLSVPVLIRDDLGFYSAALDGSFQWGFLKRSLLAPVYNFLLAETMVFSVFSARLAVLIVFIVPLSFAVYYTFSVFLSLPRPVSFFAALLPQILRGQTDIPTFIIGSYFTFGLLLYFLAVIFSMRYLKGLGRGNLAGAGLLYFACVETTEVAIPLFLPFAAFLLLLKRLSGEDYRGSLCHLLGTLGAIALYKGLYVLLFPYSVVTTPQSLEAVNLLERLGKALEWSFPNPGIGQSSVLYGLSALIPAAGVVLAILRPVQIPSVPVADGLPHFSLLSDRARWLLWYGFGAGWFLFAFLPFMSSFFFLSRYIYAAAFGLNLLLVLGLFSICYRGPLAARVVFLIALSAVTLFTGLERYKALASTFDRKGEAHAAIGAALSKVDLPPQSQVFIVGRRHNYVFTGSRWDWSTGYLQYVTGRSDIRGLVGREQPSFDPFKRVKAPPDAGEQGIDPERPLFIFRMEKNDRLNQLRYFLQWQEGEDTVRWVLYKLNPATGQMERFRTGSSRESYFDILEDLAKTGIAKSDIAWGG
jgi:hypothetical protein